ncbi:MAG TPA: glycerophosphodiester phosphodiesterase [Gaiellaceae bacterium]|nr:glycerophosphodiester phosphodiesterase [Gaiellaceae bacterium]
MVVGHRGTAEGVAPGTLAAYERALAGGVELVEMDVRRAVDGELRALHDASEDVGAPTVREVASLVAAAGAALMLDLKEIGGEHEPVEAALALLPPERLVVSTMEDVSVAALRGRFAGVRLGLSVGREWRRPYLRTRLSEAFPARRARACGASFLAVNRRLVPFGILARAPLPVYLWTVDEEPALRRFLRDPRVAAVITNRPLRALELRGA